MSLTDRDRKILLLLVPLAIAAAYWFLLLAPKREEASAVGDQLSKVQAERDTAVQRAATLDSAKRSFATDYATVIRLGKSIPTNVDMPSLLVQLDRAARGTNISFTSIKTGERAPGAAAASASTPPGGEGGPANSSTPAASGPGQAAQGAANTANAANNASGASQAGGSGAAGGSPALETIPLDFEFEGSFFDLADFFHRMKRFVHVTNDRIVVRGRLMTVNSFDLDSGVSFPKMKATMHATVYLAPKAEGASAGATQQGPAGATPPAGQTASSSSTPPAASVIAR